MIRTNIIEIDPLVMFANQVAKHAKRGPICAVPLRPR